jgi:hypothetical protein
MDDTSINAMFWGLLPMSTSQASNVVEGLESGASAFFVDEDVSLSGDQVLDVQSR